MAEERSGATLDEAIRQAAAEAIRSGDDIRRRVHDVTLEALRSRRFDRAGIRAVVRSVTEGITVGAESKRAGLREALAEGLRGLDQALTRSVEAGHEALRQIAATGRGVSDHELRQGLAGMKKIEEDFIATLDQVAGSANERVRPELREVIRQSLHAGTETGRQSARLMAEFTLAGIELAGEFGLRFAQLAGGALAGMADALHRKDEEGGGPR